MDCKTFSTLYKLNQKNKIVHWTIFVEENKYRVIYGIVGGKELVGEWTTVYGKNLNRKNATTDFGQALKEAESKYIAKLKAGYTPEQPSETPNFFQPMLAEKWNGEKFKSYPIFSQPKLDGVRCIITEDGMFSRNGNPITSVPQIFDGLKDIFDENKGLILDGELYNHNFCGDFNSIVSMVKKIEVNEENPIEYHVYDMLQSSLSQEVFEDRFITLTAISKKFPPIVKLVDTDIVNNEDEVNLLYDRYMTESYEGQILRINAPYANKRSKNLLKHKKSIDEEFLILDIVEGEGKRKGTAGYFVFKTEDGQEFHSNVKGTYKYLATLLKNKEDLIGKSATVTYFNLTPDKIPRFPYVTKVDRESYE